MIYDYRDITADDKVALYRNLDTLVPYCNKPVHALLDVDHIVDFICEKNSGNTVIVAETYLVTYVIAAVWSHPTAEVVQELGVIKLYPEGSGTLKDVVDFLRWEAKSLGCAGVCMGTTLQNDDVPLSNKLLACGLTASGRDFFTPV